MLKRILSFLILIIIGVLLSSPIVSNIRQALNSQAQAVLLKDRISQLAIREQKVNAELEALDLTGQVGAGWNELDAAVSATGFQSDLNQRIQNAGGVVEAFQSRGSVSESGLVMTTVNLRWRGDQSALANFLAGAATSPDNLEIETLSVSQSRGRDQRLQIDMTASRLHREETGDE